MTPKTPCIFVDRDGVINRERSYVTHLDDLEIFEDSVEAVKLAKQMGYKVIVITNQSAVARGLMTLETLSRLNERVIEVVGVDAIYFCPHLPPSEYEKISDTSLYNQDFVQVCECRKPLPGMIMKAAMEHHIDLARSYMVGDRESDILCAQKAGIKSVWVCGEGQTDGPIFEKDNCVKPDFEFENLYEFIKGLVAV